MVVKSKHNFCNDSKLNTEEREYSRSFVIVEFKYTDSVKIINTTTLGRSWDSLVWDSNTSTGTGVTADFDLEDTDSFTDLEEDMNLIREDC